jgi:hypothetical protein
MFNDMTWKRRSIQFHGSLKRVGVVRRWPVGAVWELCGVVNLVRGGLAC